MSEMSKCNTALPLCLPSLVTCSVGLAILAAKSRRIDDTVEAYFMKDELLRCSQFVNDASMEVTLTGARIAEFEQTFLCKH